MGINAIGTTGYPSGGYQTRKAERTIESGTVESIKTAAEQAVQEMKKPLLWLVPMHRKT